MGLIEEQQKVLADALAYKQDIMLKEALSDYLGIPMEELTPEIILSLKGRIKIEVVLNRPEQGETYVIDKTPLIKIMPMSCEMVRNDENDSHALQIIRPIIKLYESERFKQNKATKIIIVVTDMDCGDVDSRAFYENGVSIMGPDGAGEKYHLGQISSSINWAKQDMREHFKKEWDNLFPDGWTLEFNYNGKIS